MNPLPEKRWHYSGAMGRFNAAADQLRRAAILSDNAGHALREVAFSKWLYAHPQRVAEVSLALETALIRWRL